jgi:hypothetical protein
MLPLFAHYKRLAFPITLSFPVQYKLIIDLSSMMNGSIACASIVNDRAKL